MPENSVPEPPWKRAAVGRRARHSEEQLAKLDGGRRQPASGSKWFAKGDVRANGFLIDDKFTDNESFSVTRTEWEKATVNALRTTPGLRPQFRIHIKGLPKLRLMTEDDYLFLVGENVDA